ncbi:MAG: oxidoreductase [Candidatus Altiarchaeales archaeon]|nr:MAG: oxidoreductase [Candidatus Altiarchaeales archaeon]RLI94896.1 MAG: oxidoreductase [Candidatus Altiarchaeales archaeon]RLI95403.1 MAG: oxidoreductase [Candidatus Altiarchaeales archaeon]HDO82030.1 oxidoreductase [Candidatus Altiarchaeales archaeon]HEX54679.1 oxidoreductase [Candidatus Altiarchaeales archaeon]
MAKEKLKLGFYMGAGCGGCDIAVLDIHEKLLDVIEVADIVFWAPIAADAKYKDIEELPDGSVDVGFYWGAVRNSEQEHMAKVLRDKSKILVAFGSCAVSGGIPGLANIANREEIFRVVYKETASTDNPEFVTPQTIYDDGGHELTLPEFYDEVYALDEIVDVDIYMPLCPPTPKLIWTVIEAVVSGNIPPKGAIIAGDKTLCSECGRKKSEKRRITKIYRPHEIMLDQERCFLDQGVICMGPATRAGCEAICINANVPCRGCMGPTKEAFDQGGNMLNLIATIFGVDLEEMTEEEIKSLMKQIKDPLGTFYRFYLPKSLLRRRR